MLHMDTERAEVCERRDLIWTLYGHRSLPTTVLRRERGRLFVRSNKLPVHLNQSLSDRYGEIR